MAGFVAEQYIQLLPAAHLMPRLAALLRKL